MIYLGTAVVAPNGRIVQFPYPAGFNTLQAMRIANYSGDTVVLGNVHSRTPSQEYLQPQQQMVYRVDNVTAQPFASGVSFSPGTIAPGLQVEWSDDADHDFLGIYPVALPGKPGQTFGTTLVSQGSGLGFGANTNLGQFPGTQGLLAITITGGFTNTNPIAFGLQLTELLSGGVSHQGCDVTVLAVQQQLNVGSYDVVIPFTVSQANANLFLSWVGSTPFPVPTSWSYKLYSTGSPERPVPLAYTDLHGTLLYSSGAFSPVGVAANTVIPLNILGGNSQASYESWWNQIAFDALTHLGECEVTLNELTSGAGLLTPGALYDMAYPIASILTQRPILSVAECVKTALHGSDLYKGTISNARVWNHDAPVGGTYASMGNLGFLYGTTTDTGNITVTASVSQQGERYSTVIGL